MSHKQRPVGEGDALAMEQLILSSHLKFPQKNVQVLRNPSSDTLAKAMEKLRIRTQISGSQSPTTVFFYYSGTAINIDGDTYGIIPRS
jgi:hypothetical protein